MILRKGNKNDNVRYLQEALNLLNGSNLSIDGDFGGKTQSQVLLFQKAHHLSIDGVVGRNTYSVILKALDKASQFVVFLDEGHGGIQNGRYTTYDKYRGKFKVFEGENWGHWHKNKSMFCEGVFNRIVGDGLRRHLNQIGINYITVSEDYDNKLEHRVYTAEQHINASGCSGLFLSQHSNAGSGGVAEGIIAFTTRGENYSDECSQLILKELSKKAIFQKQWYHTRYKRHFPYIWNNNRDNFFDTTSDHEANYKVIFGMDEQRSRNRVGAVLMEYGFFDNLKDARFISDPKTINEYCHAVCLSITEMKRKSQERIKVLIGKISTP